MPSLLYIHKIFLATSALIGVTLNLNKTKEKSCNLRHIPLLPRTPLNFHFVSLRFCHEAAANSHKSQEDMTVRACTLPNVLDTESSTGKDFLIFYFCPIENHTNYRRVGLMAMEVDTDKTWILTHIG